MDTETRRAAKKLLADKEQLRRILDDMNLQLGIVHDPTATAEQAQAMMLADGIRPEDNVLSREIIRMRYPDEEGD